MNKTPPVTSTLMPYEKEILLRLEHQFSLEAELVTGFTEDLNLFAVLFENLVAPKGELKAGRFVVLGLLNHAHSLFYGGLQAAHAGNAAVWSACFRGLVELFGACILMLEKPDSAPNHLGNITAGKLYNAAKRAQPGLDDDLKRLHQIVHPARGAIFSVTKVVDKKAKIGRLRFGLSPLDQQDGREAVCVLANLAILLAERFKALSQNSDVLSSGQVIMVLS